MKIFDITHALQSLVPGSRWSHTGYGYEGLKWLEDNPPPTKEEIDAEITRLQIEYNGLEYQRKRRAEYPSFAEQFDTLYHGGYDAWKISIDKTKDKYPKT